MQNLGICAFCARKTQKKREMEEKAAYRQIQPLSDAIFKKRVKNLIFLRIIYLLSTVFSGP